MKNLFVIHTQYSLVLSLGIIKNRFSNNNNDLILFEDFKLTEDITTTLQDNFNSVLFRPGQIYLKNKSKIDVYKEYRKSIKEVKRFITKKYDKVFIVLDMNLIEMHIMKQAYSLCNNVKFIALEDGSYPYFINHLPKGGLDKNSTTRFIRKVLFKYILGCGKFYSFEGDFMGANTWINSIYLTYPKLARNIYDTKNKVAITSNEFKEGIGYLFLPTKTIIKNNAVILILDKLDVYEDLKNIKSEIYSILKHLNILNISVYFKYHPRETDNLYLDIYGKELDRKIAIESFYKDFLEQKPIIIGIKSTGLQTAKKMGYKVITLSKFLNEHNEDVIKFYKKIGICIPNNLDSIFKFIIDES